ncbi:TPA: hypothetical protein ACJGLG_004868 [Salmonella enterica subsp. enterica serovar Typhimurium]
MSVRVEWEKHAQSDREYIFRYLNREAGAVIAIAADDRHPRGKPTGWDKGRAVGEPT